MDAIGSAQAISAVVTVLAGVVIAAMGLSALRSRAGGRRDRRDTGGHDPGPADDELEGRDTVEISDVFERILDESDTDPIGRLRPAAESVIHRRAPLRWVRPAPRFPLGRLGFADGTVLMARARRQADLGHLVMVVATRHTVLPVDCRAEDDHLVLDLHWDRGRLQVDIVAPDQAD